MDRGERRCALPGCDTVLASVPGRPQRLYCTAAHRVAARQARRAAGPAGAGETASANLPWLVPPVPAPRGEPLVTQARSVRRGPRSCRHRRRPGRHTLAVLGAAGILAGGYALATTQVEVDGIPTAAPPVSAPPVPTGIVDGGGSTEVWAQRASVALVSVNRQLDTLAHAEQEWTRLPESRRAVRPPGPLAALTERRSILQRRQATLQSQLDAYRSLEERRRDLAVSEQHLAALQTALVDVPPAPRRSAEQAAAVAALDEQRDLRIRQRDAQRAEVESLEQGVAAATAVPLPDDDASTDRVSNDVLAAARDDGVEPGEPDERDEGELRLPQIVPGREQDDVRPRQETDTSAPPDPRGPRHGSEERDAAKKRAETTHEQKPRAADAKARVTQAPDDEAAPEKQVVDERVEDERAEETKAADEHAKDERADETKHDKKHDTKHDKKHDERRDDGRERSDAATDHARPARLSIQLVAERDAATSDRAADRSSQRVTEELSADEKSTDEAAKKLDKKKSDKKKSDKKNKSDKKKASDKKKSSKKEPRKKESTEKKSKHKSDEESSETESDDKSDDRADKSSSDDPSDD